MPAALSFTAGLIVLLVSAHIFLTVAQELASKWNISPLFISLVIVAMGTTLPELTVTIASVARNDPGLAMGNVVGSCIANLTLILGVATFFGKVKVGTTKTPKNATVLLILTLLFTILSLSSVTTEYKVLLLLVGAAVAILYEYILAVNGRNHEDKKLLAVIEKISKKKKYHSHGVYLFLFISSLIGLVLGGRITVTSVEELSVILGLSTTFLGLTVTSISTSLPELLLSIIASRKAENKIVIGTLIGSNIYNISIFPAIILFSTINYQIKKFVTTKELLFLLFITVLFYFIIFKRKGAIIEKKISILLMLLFPIFILFLTYF